MASRTGNGGADRGSSEFEIRRAELVGQIGDSLEQVLTQINALNRSLEGIIEIGNEFAQVEALWSQFENVMGNGQPAEEESRNQEHHRPGENAQT
ncbi:Dolichyl-diphosphooligosaccharide-protein glycosyltransferase subunit dad1 [Exophiala xenobiotica]|uniref:DASH complex subunit DAD1 n=1 Tax=Lithohypha guttulata TaxID=1690604 RepID=A0ABR0K7S5_9EURO|nr:Dolichyl-diphosphooligosaccharide-protein glycosyltransferase subunit dad1 [Lithohypha guttulata]KAK5316259.1 Dolichyl-diphosphooligosaccharide-protein glycosyltransferase subunit dad1 [Exophiala xenobiotica]